MKKTLFASLLFSASLLPSSFACGDNPLTKSDVEGIVASYMKEHPEAVMEAIQLAMAKEQEQAAAKMKQALIDNKGAIEKSNNIGGNAKAPVTLVAFMDPYCGYCKKFHGELNKYLKDNNDLKIVFRDIPIMGEPSDVAVRAMFAAERQGKYNDMQHAIFLSDKRMNKKQIMATAKKLGLDMDKFKKDMDSKEVKAQIEGELALAGKLGINATPTLIIGEDIMPGYIPVEALKEKVAAAKKS